MKQIIITVSPDAVVKVEAEGFKGKACHEYTKAIEDALGVVTSTKNKPEIHQAAVATQSVGGVL